MRVIRWLVRFLGWILVVAAVLVVVREGWGWLETGHWKVIPAGKLWFDLHKDSLQLIQPAIERHVWPFLWNPVLFTVLQWPAWGVLGVPGVLLALLPGGRRRRIFKP
jgi:hypothetical protein